MNHVVNIAIQVLPLGIPKAEAYRIVDAAISCIQSSGLTFRVCPFETVIEGPYSEVMKLLDDIQLACNAAGAEELIINMKLQHNFTKDVSIDDKMEQYES
jgi:uncharacterized protein YqgV (UPF0045/DUF77 family)